MRVFKFYIIFVIVMIFLSCEELHEIRVVNNSSRPLEVKIGEVEFGIVYAKDSTSHRVISDGSHELGGDLQGTVTIDGKKHNLWRLEIADTDPITVSLNKE